MEYVVTSRFVTIGAFDCVGLMLEAMLGESKIPFSVTSIDGGIKEGAADIWKLSDIVSSE